MENTWISYIGRSYNVIKANFRNRLPVKLPELTDYSQSNLLMIILDQVAGLIEVLNFYVDTAARELYVPSARRFSSLLRIARSVNYNGKARICSKADITLILKDSEGEETPAPQDILIPKYTGFRDSSGNPWLLLIDGNFKQGFSRTTLPLHQVELVENQELGTSDGSENQKFDLPLVFSHGSLSLEIGGQVWAGINSFVFSGPSDLHYKIVLDTDGKIKVEFGDGVNGLIPPTTNPIIIAYHKTLGGGGNVESDSITEITTPLTLLSGLEVECTNLSPSRGGFKVEDIEKLRKSIPDSIYTSGRLVTRKDYERVASTAPGIRDAKLDHTYPVYPIKLYVVPNLGGIATGALLDATKEYISAYGLIGPTFDVRPAGESKIVLKLKVYGNYGSKADTINTDIKGALLDLYHPQKVQINKPIYVSDIFHKVKALNSVSHLLMDNLYLSPYLRPDDYDAYLDVKIRLQKNALEKEQWHLTYIGGEDSKFQVYRNGVIISEFPETSMGSWQNDLGELGILDILINSIGVTSSVVNWYFTIYPIKTDILLDNFSIPSIDLENSEFEIIEQSDV